MWVASDELLMELDVRLIKKNVKFSGGAAGNLYRVNFLYIWRVPDHHLYP